MQATTDQVSSLMPLTSQLLEELRRAEILLHSRPAAARAPSAPDAELSARDIGTYIPDQGGVYAGVMLGDTGLRYHLFVHPDEDGDLADLAWGGYGEEIKGATSKWDGLANTLALVEAQSKHPAAQAIAKLSFGSLSDWYLPAQRELSLCWATIPGFFEKAWYWSSTQYSPGYAWGQTFVGGYQLIHLKGTKGRARAVRRLVIR